MRPIADGCRRDRLETKMTWKMHARTLALAAALLGTGLGAGMAIAHNGEHATDVTPVRADKAFIALLNGGQAVPSTTSPAMGIAFLTLERKTNDLSYNITLSGLEGTVTAVHLHAGASGEVRKPHLFPLPGADGVHMGNTGRLDSHIVRLLRRGQCYINVHTDQHTDGEIRGQVLPVKGVR